MKVSDDVLCGTMTVPEKQFRELESKVENLQSRIPYEHRDKHKETEQKLREIESNCDGHTRYQKFENRVGELEERIKELEKKAERAERISNEVSAEWGEMISGRTEIPENRIKEMIREVLKEELSVTVET